MRVTTVNRWATNASSPIGPAAVTIPGQVRAAARLYRAADIQDAWDRRVGLALLKGACAECTTFSRQVWHTDGERCPEMAAAS